MQIIPRENILNDLKTLVSFQTVSSSKDEFHRQEIAKSLSFIKKRVLEIGRFHVKEIEHEGSPSLIVGTEDTMKPDISLSGHIDVVPASKEMFKIKESNGKIYGRGVADMKFAIAIYLEILRKLKINNKIAPSLSMLITSDEEVGSTNGAKYIAEKLGYRPKLMFVPDGGKDWRVIEKAKGGIQAKVNVFGKAAHASRPWLGDSANDKLIDFVTSMRCQFPLIKKESWDAVTMNIGLLNGGLACNQISDKAEVMFDFRFPTEKSLQKIKKELKRHLPAGGIVSYPAEAYCFDVNLNHPEVKRFLTLVKKITGNKVNAHNEFAATDARFFSRLGTCAIVLMPQADGLHSENEWISIKGIIDFYQSLQNFLDFAHKDSY